MYNSKGSSLFPWIGGKRLLARTIIAEFPPHKTYVEVFGGAAHVLFRKEPARVEVLNDLNGEVINFYRIVQHHFSFFCRYIQHTLVSRSEFTRLRQMPPEVLTDIQRAARFFYLQKTCFGGRGLAPTFGVSKIEPIKFNIKNIKAILLKGHKRLSKVLIEQLPFERLIPCYSSPDTLFYCDPPYYGVEGYYGKELFKRSDYAVLRDLLADTKSKFVMSINNVLEIRELFKGFKFLEVGTKYAIGNSDRNKLQTELLIKNF
jgi:DNA adenine methylase